MKVRKVGRMRYEARSCGRSSPGSLFLEPAKRPDDTTTAWAVKKNSKMNICKHNKDVIRVINVIRASSKNFRDNFHWKNSLEISLKKISEFPKQFRENFSEKILRIFRQSVRSCPTFVVLAIRWAVFHRHQGGLSELPPWSARSYGISSVCSLVSAADCR